MHRNDGHQSDRGRTVGAEPRESEPILPPIPATVECAETIDPDQFRCEDPGCPAHGADVRRELALPPLPADLLTVDAAPVMTLAIEWMERATTLETEALIAHTEATDLEPGDPSENAHAAMAEWSINTAAALERAAALFRQAAAIRARLSDLARVLAFVGVVGVAFIGCIVPTGSTVAEACEQYEAETADAPCEFPCPWTGEGTCDVERVSECAGAVRDVCLVETPAECDAACEVRR